MDLHLTDEQAELPLAELDRIISTLVTRCRHASCTARDPRAAEAVSGTPVVGDASEAIRTAVKGPLSPPRRMKPYTGPPMTLDNAAAAKVRLVVLAPRLPDQVEPDPAEHAARYGNDLAVIDWARRLKCSQCGTHPSLQDLLSSWGFS